MAAKAFAKKFLNSQEAFKREKIALRRKQDFKSL
jgi:hypothetical protein